MAFTIESEGLAHMQTKSRILELLAKDSVWTLARVDFDRELLEKGGGCELGDMTITLHLKRPDRDPVTAA